MYVVQIHFSVRVHSFIKPSIITIMKNSIQIVTHDGIFHADEICAIALIKITLGKVWDIEITRTRNITPEMLDSKEIWLIDVGRSYDLELRNFDHHQDPSMESSNILMLQYLWYKEFVSQSLFTLILPLFRIVSDIDRNGYGNYNGIQFNTIIRQFNQLPDGFNTAIDFVVDILSSYVIDAEKMDLSRVIIRKGKPFGKGLVCYQYPEHWKALVEYTFLVAPTLDGKWGLHSRDSINHPIKVRGTEVFIHNNKFLAVYETFDDALISLKYQ